jgi:trehalose synthase
MIPSLVRAGALVIWRCHVGHDDVNDEVELAWRFLMPYLRPAHAYVFSRAAYVPLTLDANRVAIIPPSLDPFSPKNQALPEASLRAVLTCSGIIAGDQDCGLARFYREDGTPDRCCRQAEVVRQGAPPSWETPLVVQVSRWDELKDPVGVLHGFLRLDPERAHGAVLTLAGPSTRSVADDPEDAAVFARVVAEWRGLPEAARARAQIVSVPTTDVDENAAIVNALQRHAAVVAQKSLHEGFGLTVTEALWKQRPVVASAVGGIRDQIDDGVQGLLLPDPHDLGAFARAVARLLDDSALAARLGAAGHARVLERYLGIDSLLRYGRLITALETVVGRG